MLWVITETCLNYWLIYSLDFFLSENLENPLRDFWLCSRSSLSDTALAPLLPVSILSPLFMLSNKSATFRLNLLVIKLLLHRQVHLWLLLLLPAKMFYPTLFIALFSSIVARLSCSRAESMMGDDLEFWFRVLSCAALITDSALCRLVIMVLLIWM